MKQKVSNMNVEITVFINTDNNKSYICYKNQIRVYLDAKNKAELLQDTDRLEDHLLEIEISK